MKYALFPLMICLTTLTSGCFRPAPTDCSWTQPIRPHPDDRLTRSTAEQIVGHNLSGTDVCGWKPRP